MRSILDAVRESARRRILFLPHAVDEMNAPAELVTAEEVRAVIQSGEVVEDYPEDEDSQASCLRRSPWNA